jgi:hypothetical protein
MRFPELILIVSAPMTQYRLAGLAWLGGLRTNLTEGLI